MATGGLSTEALTAILEAHGVKGDDLNAIATEVAQKQQSQQVTNSQ